MKRLRESEAQTPLMRTAQRLIDAAPPLPESRERMLRIRRELDRPRGGLARMRRLPALVVAMIVGAFGASAFAAVRIFEVIRQPSSEAVPQRPAPSSARHVRRPAQHAARPPAPEQSTVPAGAQPPLNAVVAQPAPGSVPAETRSGRDQPAQHAGAAPSHHHDRSSQRTSEVLHPDRAVQRAAESELQPAQAAASGERDPAQPAAAGSDSELVHRAVKALRRDHDPALAARLLEQHRARGAAGPLAEEALSLQIEAAAALGDPRAQAFAREYLTRYPHGRYLSVAQRALRDSAP